MSDLEAEFERLRRKRHAAHLKLLDAVSKACPGPHVTRQHRDMMPPWCKACGRTGHGHMVKEPKS